jgi:hypothetical protein
MTRELPEYARVPGSPQATLTILSLASLVFFPSKNVP